jgi:hypothetical protein
VTCNKEKTDAPTFKPVNTPEGICQYEFTADHLAGCGFDVSVLLGL